MTDAGKQFVNQFGAHKPALQWLLHLQYNVLGVYGAESSIVGGAMLDNGLLAGHAEKNQPEEKDVTEQIVLSPTIKYAGSPRFAPKFE